MHEVQEPWKLRGLESHLPEKGLQGFLVVLRYLLIRKSVAYNPLSYNTIKYKQKIIYCVLVMRI